MRPNRNGTFIFNHVVMLVGLVCLSAGGCGSPKPAAATSPVEKHNRIAVTNFPLYCVVKTICDQSGSPVKEIVYCGPSEGDDPHTWVPSVDQIRDLQNVDLIICNGPGAQFSKWIDKVTIDENKLVKTTDALDLEEFVIVKDYQLVHSHGPEGEHSHSWVVPQSWLSPRIARKQATLCFKRIVEEYGQNKSLDDGFAELQKNFDSLEARVEQIRDAQDDLVVASSSPEVSYLTRELAWEDRYLQWNEDTPPDAAKKSLAEMRGRFAKQNPDAAKSEAFFLWAGQKNESLSNFVGQSWKLSAGIDLIQTPLETLGGLGPKSYFERMASNLGAVGVAVQTE